MSWFRQRDERTEHSYFEERLSAYIDGELAPREQESVEQHLATCPTCRWDLNTLRQTVQWAAELPTVPVPRAFTIPASAEPVRTARRRWTLLPVLQGATALVALLLVFAVAGDVMLTGFAPRSQSELPAIQAPAPVVETTMVERAEPAEKQVEATVVVEQEVEVEPPVAAALPEEQPPAEPGEEGQIMMQAAPSEAVTATAATSADAREMLETPMGGGTGEESSIPAGTPLPPAAEMAAPTASPPPSPEAPVTRAAGAPPTSEVVAYQSSEAAEGERNLIAASESRGLAIDWLRIVEYTLGVALILLVGTTLAIVAWRRIMG